jgi:hypothetical protein
MLNLSSVIIRLKQVADFAPQYECDVLVEDEEFRNLLESYPQLAKFPTYLEFLRITGGAHISNKTFSLGIYGFSGMVVPSFEEVVLVEQEHFFQFGEVLYYESNAQCYFVFDLRSEKDSVYEIGENDTGYKLSNSSWIEFLQRFADGDYPGMS